ncbi:uncharacterized protein ACR2FA_005682 [Aphomia sociella]
MNSSLKICRVCLEDGATIPIFEYDNEEDNINYKLSQCLKEKIEDVEGFPRSICNNCNNTLATVCNFINQYKESTKILESGLLVLVKNENIEQFNDYSDLEHSDVDFKFKTEVSNDYESSPPRDPIEDVTKPIRTKLKNRIKKEKVKKSNRNASTNKIASSILEGEFSWNGEEWCLKSNKKVKLKEKKDIVPKVKKRCTRIKINIPKEAKTFPPKLCDLCGEIFKNQYKLSTHKKTVHFKNPIKCPKCPRVCVSDYYLQRHIKRQHTMERNFICSSCGRKFAYKGELSTHYRNVHDKDLKAKKIFKCTICDKTYKCQKSVLIHERSVHTGQRPAICSVCNSSFYHEDYLKEHMRLHTGETPFKCPICGRGYAQRGNMKSHLRIHRVAEIDPAVLSKMRPNYIKLLKDFR